MSQSLNIAIVSDVFPPKSGGSGWSSFYLAKALQERGNNLQVVLPKEGSEFGQATRDYEGLPVTEFIYPASHIPFVRNYTRNERLYPRFANWLENFFLKNSIQVAHGQHYLTIPPTVIAAKRSGAVSLGTVRDYWPVCYWTTHLSGNKICPGCTPLNRVKCLYHNQGPLGIPAAPLSLYMASNLKLKQRYLAQADAVIAVSNYVAVKLARFVPLHRLHIIPNFINFKDLQDISPVVDVEARKITEPELSPQSLVPSPDKYLLYIGKLEANKGANLLLDILREARPEIPTLVAGDGSLRGQMEKAALQENLNIKFLGWQEHSEVLRLIAGAEALLFPSLWPEPLTRVLLEAIGLGALVVALNTGGTPDIIQNGANGVLAENLPEFAYKLQSILKPEQSATRERLKAGALQTAHEKFSQEAVVTRTEELYLELIAQKQGAQV